MKAGVTFLYVPLSLLSEEDAQALRTEDGFVFHRRTQSEIWSVRYVLYLTREGRFQAGEKDIIAWEIIQRASGSLRTFYNAEYGTAHFGTVTVTSPVRVSVTLYLFMCRQSVYFHVLFYLFYLFYYVLLYFISYIFL